MIRLLILSPVFVTTLYGAVDSQQAVTALADGCLYTRPLSEERTSLSLEVRVEDSDVQIRAKDANYAKPGPEEAQDF